FRVTEDTGKVVAIKEVFPADELMLITRNGVVIRQKVGEIRVIGRATQGVRLMSLAEDDILVDVARLVPDDDAGEAATPAPWLGDAPVDGVAVVLEELDETD